MKHVATRRPAGRAVKRKLAESVTMRRLMAEFLEECGHRRPIKRVPLPQSVMLSIARQRAENPPQPFFHRRPRDRRGQWTRRGARRA